MNDLADLPLKSLELPSKTVSKLKPLGPKTVRDLYALSLDRMMEAGLSVKELEEIAEAARDVGLAWASVEDVRARFASAPAAAPPPRTSKTPKSSTQALPEDVVTAFAGTATEPGKRDDVEVHFTGCVDASKRHFQTPPPSARHLRLFRALGLVRDGQVGGATGTFLVGVVDLSQVPESADVETFLLHMGNLLGDVLVRMGVKPRSQSQVGSAVSLGLTSKDVPRVQSLIRAHAAWIADGPVHLLEVPPIFSALAQAGEGQLRASLHGPKDRSP